MLALKMTYFAGSDYKGPKVDCGYIFLADGCSIDIPFVKNVKSVRLEFVAACRDCPTWHIGPCASSHPSTVKGEQPHADLQ